ncbi:hypothetical protein [Leuconostoc suionicum]|uniref:hypothetical protein n=1 Tax=Leuconostoc suionicum TaxID=1511761 RepID=UPI00233F1435|nr:hypothetical protein [Leuconostoc suionicum]MDC2805563.1 hypothetical protein [Leuconostoc suionicum]MDC2823075.1 hypothetical protein [Leuconostoc suionicum]
MVVNMQRFAREQIAQGKKVKVIRYKHKVIVNDDWVVLFVHSLFGLDAVHAWHITISTGLATDGDIDKLIGMLNMARSGRILLKN